MSREAPTSNTEKDPKSCAGEEARSISIILNNNRSLQRLQLKRMAPPGRGGGTDPTFWYT